MIRHCFRKISTMKTRLQSKDSQKFWAVVRCNAGFHSSCQRLAANDSTTPENLDVGNTKGQGANEVPESSPGPPPEARTVRGSPVSWLSLGLLLATGAGLIFHFDQEKKRHIDAFQKGRTESKPGPGVGKAAIGGPFRLTNHDGKEVTDNDFKGNWNLLYFGFTHCPDICPEELQKMVEAIDVIEKKESLRITPVFISVDPERDNVEQLREYVKEFHPRLVGLTGGTDDIRQVAREYRVYYMKVEDEGSDYLVDHSIIMYLMDPEMEFVKFFGKNYDVNGLANGIVEAIKGSKA